MARIPFFLGSYIFWGVTMSILLELVSPSNAFSLMPLTALSKHQQQQQQQQQHPPSLSAASFLSSNSVSNFGRRSHARVSSKLSMVADIPFSVVEKAATENLLDQIINESLRTSSRKPIIMEFDPSSKAIWNHWKGTVVSESWGSAVKHAIWAVLVYLVFQKYPSVKKFLDGFGQLWPQVLGVTTFTLSFFVNQSYTLWRNCLTISRTLQGRINDLMLMLAAHATREEPSASSEFSLFTPSSKQFLRVVSRYLRVFHILAYGSFTRSYRPLLTPRGLRRMADRGLLTEKERIVLKEMKVSATTKFNAVLSWVLRCFVQARKAGIIENSTGFETLFITKLSEVRAQANSMEAELRGRMPFAYAHINQILVDVALWLYPIAAFTSGHSLQLGVFGTFLLTLFYQGLYDLAKQFLDPYHNENFWKGEDAIVVDTLIAETNAGTQRFVNGLEMMTIPYKNFVTGNFDEFVLPEEGFSVEEGNERAQRQREKDMESVDPQLAPTSAEEFELKAAEILSAAADEYEETQYILNAPPGSDFVPGLDDEGESVDNFFPLSDEPPSPVDGDGDLFNQYREATEQEFQDQSAVKLNLNS